MKPLVPLDEFCTKFGFKKCKKPYNSCYYLCISRGKKMLFLSPQTFMINDWNKNDPRIHKDANCYYRDIRTAEDILVQLVQCGMVGNDWDEVNSNER